MARSLPKVCPFLVTVDLKLKWPELPVAELPRPTLPPGKIVFGADSVPEWRLGTRPLKLSLLIRAHFYGFESGSQ